MDKKTKGSWLIHNTNKLQAVTSQEDFPKTFIAGKAGILLSAISADAEMNLSKEKINVLAKASNINTYFELPPLLDVLEKQGVIDRVSSGDIQVLGVTSSSILNHTSDIFDNLNPEVNEIASIELAERASILPILTSDICEEISDKYEITKSNTLNLIQQAEIIGFVDVEKISDDERLLFNGNLFRRDNPKKVLAVMESLKDVEKQKLLELNDKKLVC